MFGTLVFDMSESYTFESYEDAQTEFLFLSVSSLSVSSSVISNSPDSDSSILSLELDSSWNVDKRSNLKMKAEIVKSRF